jgi:hypothetical protein
MSKQRKQTLRKLEKSRQHSVITKEWGTKLAKSHCLVYMREVIGETQENPSAGQAKGTEANSTMQNCTLTDSWHSL